MEAGTELARALFVLSGRDLNLREGGSTDYGEREWCPGIIRYGFIHSLLYMLVGDSCSCPITLRHSCIILLSGFCWILDSAPNQAVILNIIMDSVKHLLQTVRTDEWTWSLLSFLRRNGLCWHLEQMVFRVMVKVEFVVNYCIYVMLYVICYCIAYMLYVIVYMLCANPLYRLTVRL